MDKDKTETRGRKPLSKNEPTIRAGICLPLNIYDTLVAIGEESGRGYGFHVRQAIDTFLKSQESQQETNK